MRSLSTAPSASLVRNGLRNSDKGAKGGDTQHDFRLRFSLARQVKHADLFVTGKDTAAAWVNGKQVLQAQPLPPWKQAPWKTYLKQDVTTDLHTGDNLLADRRDVIRNAFRQRYGLAR